MGKLVRAKFPSKISTVIENLLEIQKVWTKLNGLSINLTKIELVLFTKMRKEVRVITLTRIGVVLLKNPIQWNYTQL